MEGGARVWDPSVVRAIRLLCPGRHALVVDFVWGLLILIGCMARARGEVVEGHVRAILSISVLALIGSARRCSPGNIGEGSCEEIIMFGA